MPTQAINYGVNPGQIEAGIHRFDSSDLTVELATNKRIIRAITATAIGATAIAVTVDEAGILSDGNVINRPTNGKLTIKRESGGPSGMAFSYIIIGD
jgi:hypothetical protein